jgi:uncharacterized spore protein YtfJ
MGFDAQTVLTKAADNLSATRSVGPVIEAGGRTVIPVAYVLGAGGGGGGEGPPESANSGSGSGGGYVNVTWPVGAYVVDGDYVRWVPALDTTRLVVAGLALVGAGLKLFARRRSG